MIWDNENTDEVGIWIYGKEPLGIGKVEEDVNVQTGVNFIPKALINYAEKRRGQWKQKGDEKPWKQVKTYFTTLDCGLFIKVANSKIKKEEIKMTFKLTKADNIELIYPPEAEGKQEITLPLSENTTIVIGQIMDFPYTMIT